MSASASNSMSENTAANEHWDSVITPHRGYLDLNIRELWRYRDLLRMFVKKDIITVYKQTILGPVWFVIQPILTSLTYVIVFCYIAKISTKGIPPILFYLGSVTMWNYFSETLNVTSKTFTDNASIFGKVYFPRLILPLSKVISGLMKFFIQFGLFFVFWIYYVFIDRSVTPNAYVAYAPLVLMVMAAMGLAFGLVVTSMTTKYRDLAFLVTFGVGLLMYATPVIYPLSSISEKYRFWLWLNPLTSLFETFKFGFLGNGMFSLPWLLYSIGFTIVLLAIGVILFNRVEKRFIDTV